MRDLVSRPRFGFVRLGFVRFGRVVGLLIALLAGTLPAGGTRAQALPDTLTFDAAAARLLKASPSLRAARAEARSRVQSAEDAARFPNPSLRVSEERTNLEGEGVDDQWYLGLTQPLRYPGEHGAYRRSADARRRAGAARVREEKARLYNELRHRYLDVVLARRRHDVLSRFAQAVARAARAGEVRADEGDLGSVQRSRLQVARATYRNDRAEARRELRRARVELAYLLTPGAQAQASAAAAGSLRVRGEPRFEPVAVDADAALARARRSRPALAAARSRLEAERAGARAARYARYPDLAVSAGPKRQSLPGATTYGYTAGISIGLPLWNGGGAAAEAQQGRAEQAAAELEAARRRVDVEVRDALQRLDTYRTRRQAVARELPAGSLLEDAVFVYEQGEMSLFELLDAVGAARDAALLRLRLTGRYLRALYDLERALGVGPGDGPVVIDGALDPHAGELS